MEKELVSLPTGLIIGQILNAVILVVLLVLIVYLISCFIRRCRNNNTLLLLLVTSPLALGSCAKNELTQKSQSADWALLWADEFTTDGAPDSTKWSFADRKSADWACYCADTLATASVKDGQLYLRGIVNRDETDTAKYKTACIQTKDKFAFRYGKVEVRAKLSKGKGSWPAIWLMPQDSKYGGWPHGGEVDIM